MGSPLSFTIDISNTLSNIYGFTMIILYVNEFIPLSIDSRAYMLFDLLFSEVKKKEIDTNFADDIMFCIKTNLIIIQT